MLDKSGVRYLKAHGSFTYGQATPVTRDNPRTTLATRYDMARCVGSRRRPPPLQPRARAAARAPRRG